MDPLSKIIFVKVKLWNYFGALSRAPRDPNFGKLLHLRALAHGPETAWKSYRFDHFIKNMSLWDYFGALSGSPRDPKFGKKFVKL